MFDKLCEAYDRRTSEKRVTGVLIALGVFKRRITAGRRRRSAVRRDRRVGAQKCEKLCKDA